MRAKITNKMVLLVVVSLLANMLMNGIIVFANNDIMQQSTESSDIIESSVGKRESNTYFSESFDGKKKDIVLPLVKEVNEEGDFVPSKEPVTATTQIFDQSFQISDEEITSKAEKIKNIKSISLMSVPSYAIPVNENEVKVLNTEDSEEKTSYYTFVFTPSTTSYYKITASSEKIPYIYIYDSEYKTLGWNRTYPKVSDSVAAKFYKDQQYIITLSSVSLLTPTKFSISKYESASKALTYTFIDNTYIADENASVVVTVPSVGADILYGVLDRDILIEARLLKDGILLDTINEIPQEYIKGGRGTPDDNILQFICEFNKRVEHGEYTLEITCRDILGNIVIDTCETAITIGNPVTIYMPSDSLSYTGDSYSGKKVFFKDVNTNRGKFIVFDNDRLIGKSDNVNVGNTRIQHSDFFSDYSSIDSAYDPNKFEKMLYHSYIPSITLNEVSQTGKNYEIKFVAGVSEYDTTAKLIPTDALILNYISSDSLDETDTHLKVYTGFYNIKNVNIDDISVELVDLSGNVIASKQDYVCYNARSNDELSNIHFNLRIQKPVEASKNYSLKISYPGQCYTNTLGSYIKAYSGSDYLSLSAPKILDAEKLIISVPTYSCDNSLEYNVALSRINKGIEFPISEILNAKPDEYNTFILDFPNDTGRTPLFPGEQYRITFSYETYSGRSQYTSQTFTMPSKSYTPVEDKSVSFNPPIIPETIGEIKFTVSGYEIENGIMGAENENINIELVADDEVYGAIKKDTIEKSASVYNANPDYSMSQVTITGTLEVSKRLKEDTQYYIRINGTDYKYFYNSSEGFVNGYCEVKHSCSDAEFEDLSGSNSIVHEISERESLELDCTFVKNTSHDLKLVMKNIDTGKVIEAGVWDTTKSHFKGEYKDISIKVDLSDVYKNEIYELYLSDGEKEYSLDKYVRVIEADEASGFSVEEAVYGRDTFTVSISSCDIIDGYSFDIKDYMDNVIDCDIIPESVRQGSNNLVYLDVKTESALTYGVYSIRMYNADNALKYIENYTVSVENSNPYIEYIENGIPHLIHGKNLPDEGEYTADIIDNNNNIRMVKGGIPLIKRGGESILELTEDNLGGLHIGYYYVSVKLNGSLIGAAYLNYSGSLSLKPLIMAKEWSEPTSKSPMIKNNNVELLIKTMYYTKFRCDESLEELQNKDYQTVTNSVYYEFESLGKQKTLYFQFADDSQKESEIITFKAYWIGYQSEISIISPEVDMSFDEKLIIKAEVSNNPYKVWAVIKGSNPVPTIQSDPKSCIIGGRNLMIPLIREEGTDYYSQEILSDNTWDFDRLDIYAVDEYANITGSESLVLEEPDDTPGTTTPRIQINRLNPYYYNKRNIIIKGSNASANSIVRIYAYHTSEYGTYSTTVVANEAGEFEGMLNVSKDGGYSVSASDSNGRTSYSFSTMIDTIEPVLKNYATVAQGVNSVRISWDSTDSTSCRYTLWRDDRLIENQYSEKYYIATGLSKRQTYVYKVMATDSAGNNSEPVEIIVTVGDEEAPSIPENLHVSSHAAKSITLSWDASTDNSYVAGYDIFRDGEKIGTSYTTSFTDKELTKGVEYSYRIRAFDPSMSYSDFSETIMHSPAVTSIEDAYDGSYNVVALRDKSLTLKAVSKDILNNDNIYVTFEYSKNGGESWFQISKQSQYTTTPDGLLFSTVWKIENYTSGEYVVRYTLTDRDGFTDYALSQVIHMQKTDDFTSPTITSILPLPSCFRDSIPLTILAEDNVRLKTITLQDSMDGVTWENVTTITISGTSKKYYWHYNLDVSDIREGAYYVRAIAEDTSGNRSNSTETASYNQYIIDRTEPEKVKDVTAAGGIDQIEIKWGINSEPYINGFTVERSERIDGRYQTVASNIKSLNYFDLNAKTGIVYYYRVICNDIAGNSSQPSDPVQARVLNIDEISDDIPPEITSMTPANNSVVGSNLSIAVTAKDDVVLSKIVVQYSTDDEVWHDLYIHDTAYSYAGFTQNMDTIGFEEGTILKVRAYAVDAKGNVGNFENRDYIIDNSPPEKPSVSVVARSRGLEISWSCDDEDVKSIRVYRKTSISDFYTVIGEYWNSSSTILDENLDPSYAYIYKVTAVDKYGNMSSSESIPISPLDIDDVSPVAQINCISSAEVGVGIEFDGTGSIDNIRIAKYEWNFGDGTKGTGARFIHSYSTEGVYEVVLKVVDPSGNESSATRTITIVKKGMTGTVNVSILGSDGRGLAYTDVYVNLGDDNIYKKKSDSDGKISLKLEAGTYRIGAFRDGYAPQQQEVLIEEGKENNLTLVLRESQLVVGGLTATKMTLEEIKNAGIDVTAPGNQNVFKYQINLVYQNRPYNITHISNNTSGGSFGGRYTVGDRTVHVSTAGNVNGRAPVVVILDVPGSVTWLKDFFDVKLHLVNAMGDYDINNCVVNLNTPAGVSVVGGSKQIENIGTLAANGNKLINWIVRGDRAGSYNLSADFSGILESFNEAISATFALEEPIVVEDSSRLKLIIEVEEKKYPGDNLLYRVGFKNERNSDLNRPKISMQDSEFIRSYKTSESMNIINTTHEVLKPGEILWNEYFIDPELFDGKNNVTLTLKEYAAKALGGMKIPIEIRAVEYGTFGRVKPGIYVINPTTGSETKVERLELIRYRSKENDIMPDLKIKTGRGISEDVIITEACDLTISDGVFGGTQKITTNADGEYIYKGGSIDDVAIPEGSGYALFDIKVTSDTKVSDTQRVRIVDQNLISRDDFGSISGYVWDEDTDLPLRGATVIVGSHTCITDINGRFRFEDIMLDRDVITVRAEDFPEKVVNKKLSDGTYVTIRLSKRPEITEIRSAYSSSENNRSSVIPLNLFDNSITFKIDTEVKEGSGEVEEYVYRIIDRYGNTKHEGTSTSDYATINNIKYKMSVGDRLQFAVKTKGDYGEFVSDYVDTKLVVAPELTILNGIAWERELWNSLPAQMRSAANPKISGINNAVKFFEGSDAQLPFPEGSGIFNSTKLIPVSPSFDLKTEYDFANAKATIVNVLGAGSNFNLAKWKYDDPNGSGNVGIGADADATFNTVIVYNDRTLKWEIESLEMEYTAGASISVQFKYSVPLDATFGGVLLSGYAAVKLEGGVEFIVNVAIPDVSELDSLDDLVAEVQANIYLAIRGAIGASVGYGLLSGEFFVKGQVDFNIPSFRTELTLTYGVGYGYLWFFSGENSLGEKTWVLYSGREEEDNSGENTPFALYDGRPVRSLRMLANNVSDSEGMEFVSAIRDYLEKQEWIGEEEIASYVYPDSDAKIAAIDEETGDLMMVFIGDDSDRDDNNRTAIYSSIYRDGKWSEPMQIEDDGTGDAFPGLAVDGKDIYSIWLDMSEEMGETSTLTEDDITKNVLGKMEISIAKFDADTNSWSSMLSQKTEGVNKLPEVAAGDGRAIATWVNNADMKMIGNDAQPDDIYYVYNDGSGWTEPKAFITDSANVSESDLYFYGDKAYYVFTTNAHSDEGVYKLYVTSFDGSDWSEPIQLLDNMYEDSHPAIAVENNEPVVFWHNNGSICKISLKRPFGAEIIINSNQAEDLLELSATNTEQGIALAWTNVVGGEQRLYVSTYEEESSTWTEGIEVKFDSMEVPRDVTIAGFKDTIMAVYNKAVYVLDEENNTYYKDGTLLTSTEYVRKADLAIQKNGLYFEDGAPLPGEETTVVAQVKNVGDLTAEGLKVSLYEGENLIAEKDMQDVHLSHGNTVLASFDWQVPEGCSAFSLRAVLEAESDYNPSNDSATLEVLYTDAEITGVYNELYTDSFGAVYVEVRNSGYSSIENATVQISTDKEFKNIIGSKEIKDMKPYEDKTVVFDLEVSEEQIADRARIYARIEADKGEITYLNNTDFTILRPLEAYTKGIPTPDPTPSATPSPTPEISPTPSPTPEQTPDVSPSPDASSTPDSTPDGGTGNGGSSGGAGSGGNSNVPSKSPVVVEPTPSPTEIPIPSPTDIPSSGGIGKFKAYMRGYEDKTFRPENSLTRAEMAVILANLDGAEKDGPIKVDYKDVSKDHWAAWAISYASEKGYFKGYGDNDFRPDRYITRAELSVVLCKYLNIEEIDVKDHKFADIEGHWAEGFINRLISDGYIKGYPDNTFKPDNNIKRSECVSLINRILGVEPLNSAKTSFKDVGKDYWALGDIMAAVLGSLE